MKVWCSVWTLVVVYTTTTVQSSKLIPPVFDTNVINDSSTMLVRYLNTNTSAPSSSSNTNTIPMTGVTTTNVLSLKSDPGSKYTEESNVLSGIMYGSIGGVCLVSMACIFYFCKRRRSENSSRLTIIFDNPNGAAHTKATSAEYQMNHSRTAPTSISSEFSNNNHIARRHLSHQDSNSSNIVLGSDYNSSGESTYNSTLVGTENYTFMTNYTNRTSSFMSKSSGVSLRPVVVDRTFRNTLFSSDNFRESNIDENELEIVSVIGYGGFGEVLRAKYGNQQVALKRLHTVTPAYVKQFVTEIKLLLTFRHENIVQFLGTSWLSALGLCAVMEFMPEGDLTSFLKQNELEFEENMNVSPMGSINQSLWPQNLNKHISNQANQVNLSNNPYQLQSQQSRRRNSLPFASSMNWPLYKLRIALDCAKGLAYLHSLSPPVIHRDIKSRNILISSEYRGNITDFGLSREISLTTTMTNGVGTHAWMAPESIRSEKSSEKIDVFSLGVVFCEIDTGTLPYDGHVAPDGRKLSGFLLGYQVAHEGLRPDLSPSCPKQIKELISQCVSNDPTQRPSCQEIVEYLQALL